LALVGGALNLGAVFGQKPPSSLKLESAMSTTVWKIVGQTSCVYTGWPAELLEQRVYFDEHVPDVGQPYRVLARKCSRALECNQAGYSCQWAYTNPGRDPFTEQRA
jgi:hypothetical protein